LNYTELTDAGGVARIAKNGYSRHRWRKFSKHIEPLSGDAVLECDKSGSVASRS